VSADALAVAVAVVLWIGVTAYAVLGGADFGAGFWDLTAGGARRGRRPRALIDLAIGPVWEANHVWLIFVLVVLWTAFPGAFGAIMRTLYVPLALAALGIVARGAGFAFRHAVTRVDEQRVFGAAFAVASVTTPFFLGAVAGAIAAGEVPLGGDAGDPWGSWTGPVPLVCGVLAVAVTAQLAAVFLVGDAMRHDAPDLVRHFTVRAVAAAVVAGVLALAALAVLRAEDSSLYDGLTGDGLPFVALSALSGTAALVLLARGSPRGTRELAALAVAAVVWGWGVAQDPYLLPGALTVTDGAAGEATLVSVIVVVVVAVAVIVPSLVLLYRLDQASLLETDELPAAPLDPAP
jgi:cytochrome d ubiquinol oxidase subunit II